MSKRDELMEKFYDEDFTLCYNSKTTNEKAKKNTAICIDELFIFKNFLNKNHKGMYIKISDYLLNKYLNETQKQ